MQDILVHVWDHEKRTPAARFAARLAARLDAALTAVYVCPELVFAAPVRAPEVTAAMVGDMRQMMRAAVRARQGFLEWTSSLGVTRAEWLVAQGLATHALAQAATRHDLLVLDHPRDTRESPWDVPRLILGAAKPCIVVPSQGEPSGQFERIAIGWNGSPEAMRAVHAALPFLIGKNVLLLRGEEDDRHQEVEWQPAFDIRAYLRRHDVKVRQRKVEARPADAGAVLLEEAGRFRADLLVMGAYGRSRFSEWMLGGATRHVLTQAAIPVLLRH